MIPAAPDHAQSPPPVVLPMVGIDIPGKLVAFPSQTDLAECVAMGRIGFAISMLDILRIAVVCRPGPSPDLPGDRLRISFDVVPDTHLLSVLRAGFGPAFGTPVD